MGPEDGVDLARDGRCWELFQAKYWLKDVSLDKWMKVQDFMDIFLIMCNREIFTRFCEFKMSRCF